MITEDQLEEICLEWFREGGYEYAFGSDIAYDGLPELERLILATVATEQVVTHNRIMEISIDHSHDLTQAFQRLVKAGWLQSSGHGRGTVYHRPDQAVPTPEQVFGEALLPEKEDLIIFNGSSEHLNSSSEHLRSNSEHLPASAKERTGDGLLIVGGLEKPLIDDLELLPPEMLQELTNDAKEPQEKRKMSSEEMDRVILHLCANFFLTLQVLANLVNRSPDGLRQRYLKRLVEEGKLKLAFPTAPNHPQQAYTTFIDDK